ncbi:MAG TPA: agmatinase [Solirubrobacteraceae bacterium]|nr:agmatinase [Solirubrobacteraceae bacterium]
MANPAPVPPPNNFLALEDPYGTLEAARVVILPVPLEATVSWGAGTADGPRAIIAASRHVELYDREHDCAPALDYGIHTLPALELATDPGEAVPQIAAAVADAAAGGRLVVALGGEHTISAGVNHGLLEARDGPLTVVQLDAHSDLRDSYDGTPFSHACVARRILEDPRVEQVLQLGVRSVDAQEVAFARESDGRVRVWYADDVHAGGWREEFVARVRGRRIHLTIDVDALDPAVVPATGTPEPDGLSWREAMDIISATAAEASIVGIDCVELAPQPGLHHADFAVAKLLYRTITYAMNGA